MASVIRTTLTAIVVNILTRLQAVTGLGPEAVFLDQRDDNSIEEAPSQADTYYVLCVLTSRETPHYVGAGRIDTRETQTIKVTCWTRLALDEPGRSTEWLTNLSAASLAHLDQRHKIWDALSTWFSEDSDGNGLITHPIEPRNADVPRKAKIDTHWGRSALQFELTYRLALDQSVQ